MSDIRVDFEELDAINHHVASRCRNIKYQLSRLRASFEGVVSSEDLSGSIKDAINLEMENHHIPLTKIFEEVCDEIERCGTQLVNDLREHLNEHSSDGIVTHSAVSETQKWAQKHYEEHKQRDADFNQIYGEIEDIVSLRRTNKKAFEGIYFNLESHTKTLSSRLVNFNFKTPDLTAGLSILSQQVGFLEDVANRSFTDTKRIKFMGNTMLKNAVSRMPSLNVKTSTNNFAKPMSPLGFKMGFVNNFDKGQFSTARTTITLLNPVLSKDSKLKPSVLTGEISGISVKSLKSSEEIDLDSLYTTDYGFRIHDEPIHPRWDETVFDSDFPFDPDAVPTQDDYEQWKRFGLYNRMASTPRWWRRNILKNTWPGRIGRLFAPTHLQNSLDSYLVDGVAAYTHYRYGNGEDFFIDLEKAFNQDTFVRENIENEISRAQRNIETLRGMSGIDEFNVSGDLTTTRPIGLNPEDAHPTTENWQKAIGRFHMWSYSEVRFENGVYYATMTVNLLDRYNFNYGDGDIASGLADHINGRFEKLGWATPFTTYGDMRFEVSWSEGSIGESEITIYGSTGR